MIFSESEGPISVVRIDRPDRRNAFTRDALGDLLDALEKAVEAESRVVVISGAGGHFCAGADLSELDDRSFEDPVRDLLVAITEVPMPVIASISGACLGLGIQLAVACDLRVCTPDARIGLPAARRGFMVDHWTVQRLALLAGHGPARAMLLGAEVISGTEAHRLGFAQRLGDTKDALGWAAEIAALAPLSVQGFKIGLNTLASAPDVSAYSKAFDRAWSSRDMTEGIRAFFAREEPDFRGE